jgi:hypothetical protein
LPGSSGPQGPAGPPGASAINLPVSVPSVYSDTKGLTYSDDANVAKYLGNDVIHRPLGTKEVPARSCKHLAKANPTFDSGLYYIDPNGGKISDAVQVYCDMEKQQTCVEPTKKEYPLSRYFNESISSPVWFGEATGFYQFEYDIDSSQLAFLKLLHSRASQRLTVNCHQVAVVNDATESRNKPWSKAVRLFTDNARELLYQHSHMRYHVQKDDCQYKKKSYAQTILDINTESKRLPIRDIAFSDGGGRSQEIGVALTKVCFS